MKLRRVLACIMTGAMLCTMTACGSAPKGGGGKGQSSEKIPITILARSDKDLTDVGVIRDLLTKAGFEVTLSQQPDFGSFRAQMDAGNYDLAISSWASISGNGDYAVRSLFHSKGSSNHNKLNDPEIDALIDKAGELSSAEAAPIYREVEERLIEEGYIVPICAGRSTLAYNNTKLKSDGMKIYKGNPFPFERADFVDESKRETEPLMAWQLETYLTSMDPVRSMDNSSYLAAGNSYLRLVNFSEDLDIICEGALSRNYSMAEGGKEFYFVLRDDVFFGKAENGKAVDTGERVGAEDAVYSLNRVKDENSVPGNAAYSLYGELENAEVLTDITELDKKDSETGKSVKEALEAKLDTPISGLEADKANVDNQAGRYQIVKVTTVHPFPQIFNFLAHISCGIVSEKQVEAINSKVDFASYDTSKDILYGDDSTLMEGDKLDNHLYCSGPYVMLYRNDYEIVMEKNPNYMKGTESEPKISQVRIKMIKDKDSALSALRSGEIYMADGIDGKKEEVVESTPELTLIAQPGLTVYYGRFNMDEGKAGADKNFRLAVQNLVNQEAIVAVSGGKKYPVTSTLTPIMETGYTFTPDEEKAKEYLNAYIQEK